jgi:mRNA-degrading endonuclease YafQ of YafQ-DinJ toxin-antitoxin module
MHRPIHKVSVTPRFDRSFVKLPQPVQEIANSKDHWFRLNAFDPRLKTHPLKGKLKGLWSYSVNYDYRILFEFLSPSEVLYHDIGTHNVYR